MVHSLEAYEMAVKASKVLFGQATHEALEEIDEATFLSVFEGVPMAQVPAKQLEQGIGVLDLLVNAGFFPSKGELRKLIKSGGVSLNKEKVQDDQLVVTPAMLINQKYLIVQRGKKNYFLLQVV